MIGFIVRIFDAPTPGLAPQPPDIRLEGRRGPSRVTVSCLLRGSYACTAWLRKWVAMIHIDTVWLDTEPMDMLSGTDMALARDVNVFGEAQPHRAYLFANRRANRMKARVHDRP